MKKLLITSLSALVLAAFATSVLASGCSECPADGDKDKAKEKTEQSSES